MIVEWYFLTPKGQVPALSDASGDNPVKLYNRHYDTRTPDTVEDNLRVANERTNSENAQFLVEDTGKVHVVWPGVKGQRRKSCYPDMDTAVTAVLVQR